jgi:hypothetical protein
MLEQGAGSKHPLVNKSYSKQIHTIKLHYTRRISGRTRSHGIELQAGLVMEEARDR